MILRLVGRTQPESRGLSTPLLVSQNILPSLDLILRPILQINLSLSGYWDQRSYAILQVHLGFYTDTHLEGYWIYLGRE